MVKFWKYYKYYFCTLWKRPLVWLLTGGMIYAQYEQNWQIQAMIYVGFALLLPLAVSAERCRMDYELEDIADGLAKRDENRDQRRATNANATVREDEEQPDQPEMQEQIDADLDPSSETFGGFNSEADDASRDQ